MNCAHGTILLLNSFLISKLNCCGSDPSFVGIAGHKYESGNLDEVSWKKIIFYANSVLGMNELIFLFVGIAVLLAIMLCRAKWREILTERDGTAETLDEANTDHRSYMVLKISLVPY